MTAPLRLGLVAEGIPAGRYTMGWNTDARALTIECEACEATIAVWTGTHGEREASDIIHQTADHETEAHQ